MITTSEFKQGVRFLHEDEPYVIVDMSTQSPSARGAATLVKVKARNLVSGKLVNETFKSGTKFNVPDIRYANVQYLYTDGDDGVFMDQENYEQFNLRLDSLGNCSKYLNEELKLNAMYFNDNPINISFPQHVRLQVETVEPGTRGNTASGSVTTKATLSNGVDVQVPLNIKDGDYVLIDPESDAFYQRG